MANAGSSSVKSFESSTKGIHIPAPPRLVLRGALDLSSGHPTSYGGRELMMKNIIEEK